MTGSSIQEGLQCLNRVLGGLTKPSAAGIKDTFMTIEEGLRNSVSGYQILQRLAHHQNLYVTEQETAELLKLALKTQGQQRQDMIKLHDYLIVVSGVQIFLQQAA